MINETRNPKQPRKLPKLAPRKFHTPRTTAGTPSLIQSPLRSLCSISSGLSLVPASAPGVFVATLVVSAEPSAVATAGVAGADATVVAGVPAVASVGAVGVGAGGGADAPGCDWGAGVGVDAFASGIGVPFARGCGTSR